MVERNFITPQIREELDAINDSCIRMHLPPPPVLFKRFSVSDLKTGEIQLVQVEKANSWTRNFYNWLAIKMGYLHTTATFGAGFTAMKNTSGTVKEWGTTMVPDHYDLAAISGRSANSEGLVIGTGTGAESFESVALDTAIAHGTAAGQMSYQAGSRVTCTYNEGTKKLSQAIERVFVNTSGNSINVAESGWVLTTYSGSTRYYLIERNLLAEVVAVANNKILTMTYTLEMVFPA